MAKAKEGRRIYIATDSGVVQIGEESHTYTKGRTLVEEGHPILKAVPDSFVLSEERVHYPVEQATAGPGEVRGAAGTPGTVVSAADELEGMTVEDLKVRAEEMGLPTSGTKAELKERIISGGPEE